MMGWIGFINIVLEAFAWSIGVLAAISLFVALWFLLALIDHLMFPYKDGK